MKTTSRDHSWQERTDHIAEVLRIWARALGCPTSQVADVVCRAGLPIEKLWNSLNALPRGH